MLHMKFEEQTSNTDVSGKNKKNEILQKITIILILKTSLYLKMSYNRILNDKIIMTIPHY